MSSMTCIHCGVTLAARQKLYCSRACINRHPIEPRFWSYVDKTDTCWLWTGGTGSHGYGSFDGHTLAHRFSYELHCGPIAAGLFVLHHCDTHRCVRPDHLFLGTQLDNMRDMVSKGRSARGERLPGAKLTGAKVLEIRQKYATGGISYSQLAPQYDISPRTVGDIVSGKRWAWLCLNEIEKKR